MELIVPEGALPDGSNKPVTINFDGEDGSKDNWAYAFWAVQNWHNRIVRLTRQWPSLHMGASPRAGAMLALASRARAALDGRDYVIPDDVKTLALPALRHKVVLSPAAEIEGRRVDQVIAALIDQAPAPR